MFSVRPQFFLFVKKFLRLLQKVCHTKVLLDKGIIDKGIIHTKVLLDKGIVRN